MHIWENDRKAKRLGKAEFSTHIISKELHKAWIKNNPEYKGKVDFKRFKEIWAEIAQEIRTETCTNSLGVYFPFFTGETKIQLLPPYVKAIDLIGSNDLGEKVNQLNITTKGKIAKLTWQRRRAGRFNKMIHLFGFEQDRKFGKHIYEAISQNPELFRSMKPIKNNNDKPRNNIES